ncbi:uncharacterized protein LOC143146230 [Ptiloglossa arizonensis]|uniref:uncharacterized protein LOC143146230 n=1 Tax=Ptiloglossa arizonensis TaxID=3350558 RepID=UPI003FA09FCD
MQDPRYLSSEIQTIPKTNPIFLIEYEISAAIVTGRSCWETCVPTPLERVKFGAESFALRKVKIWVWSNVENLSEESYFLDTYETATTVTGIVSRIYLRRPNYSYTLLHGTPFLISAVTRDCRFLKD